MKYTLPAISLLLLAACATTASDPDSATGASSGNRNLKTTRTNDCVYRSSIDGFDVLDNRYVVLYSSGRRRAYLAEISGACFDVKNRSTLATIDGDDNGRICGYGSDSIAFRNFGRLEQCRILSLEQLSDLRRYEVLGEGPPTPKGKSKEDEDDDGE